jgi:hypothetical protein
MAVDRREHPVRSGAWLRAAALGTLSLSLLLGASEIHGREGWLEPLQAQTGRQGLWLAARGIALWLVIRATDERRGRLAWALPLFAVSLFVASLAVRALALPLLAVSVLVTWGGDAGGAPRRRVALLVRRFGLVLAVAGVSLGLAPLVASLVARVVAPSGDATPNVAVQTVSWLERDNPFRARSAAAAWASTEAREPGEGTLVLSEIEWSLGHREVALGRARDAAERARNPGVARRAAELRDLWLRERP